MGGSRIIEYTSRGDNAHIIFEKLIDHVNNNCPGLILGVGSLTNSAESSYFIQIGANFIVKKISPNKTLEGLAGGMIGSIIFGLVCGHIFEINFLPLIFMLGGFLAFIGDLLISYFKRQSGVKDTGSILPGHGGILDRIDSHLIATPILILLL